MDPYTSYATKIEFDLKPLNVKMPETREVHYWGGPALHLGGEGRPGGVPADLAGRGLLRAQQVQTFSRSCDHYFLSDTFLYCLPVEKNLYKMC